MQGRLLTEANLHSIRKLRAEHPQWSRRQLSDHLAQQWQWRNEAGRLKDMAVRTLLLNFSQAGIPLLFGALGAALGIAPAFWAMATVLAGGGYWLRKR